MAMVYDYDSGPAWRKNLGLSPETWVDDSESYGVRYVPQGAAPSMSRRRPGYVSPSTLPQDQADFNYARQAEALGTTANYLMYGYARDKGELSAAVRQGDAERARLVRDRMLRWTDEHRDSLTEWSVVANGLGGTADRFAQNAQAILQESYLDERVATFAVDRSGRPVGDGMTARDFLGSKTPEAKAYAAEAAKRKLNLGSDAAAIFSDPDNPLYDALMTQRRDYTAAEDAFGKATDDEAREKARRSQQRATLSLQNAAEFAAAHQDSPEAVRDFLSGIGSSQWFANVSRGEMDDYFRMYAKDVEAGKVRNSADWFGELSQAFSSIGPTQRRIEFDKNGARRVVTEPSEFTRPERIPGMFVKAREILEDSGRDVDLSALSASLRQNVQKADVIARMAGVHDPQLLGLGDAAVAATVYSYSGSDSGLLNAGYRGQALANTGRTLDDAYANAVKLANVMGVNLDEATPVNGASSDSPGLLGSTQLDVYRAVLRHSLRGGSGDEDGLRNELADIFSRGSSADGAHDYQGLADAVYGKITRNMQAGLKMDLEQVLREIGGGLQVGTVRTQDGRVVPVMQRVVPPGNRPVSDYATLGAGLSTPDASPRLAAMEISKQTSNLESMQSDRLLGEWFSSPSYAGALRKDGKGGLLDAARAVASEIVDVHQRQRAGKHWESVAASAPAGKLLVQNLKDGGAGRLVQDKDDEAFVANDLLRFLDGHDKVGSRIGDGKLNERAVKYLDRLSSRILREGMTPDPTELNLWARVVSECLNRGQYDKVVAGDTRKILEKIGQVPESGQVLEDVGRGDLSSLGWAATDVLQRAGGPGGNLTGHVYQAVAGAAVPLAPTLSIPTVAKAVRGVSVATDMRKHNWLVRLLNYAASPFSAALDALSYASEKAFTFSEDETQQAFADLTNSLGKVYGIDDVKKSDPLKDAGLEILAERIGEVNRKRDYAGILRKFDIAQQMRAPATAVDTAGRTSEEPATDESVAGTANYVLSTQMSVDDELASLMGRLASNVSTELADPKAVQDFAALMMPLVRERLRREGSAAALDLVDRQGKLRRHISKATSGSNPFQDGLITKEQQDELIENVYGGDRNAYNKAQKKFLAEMQKFDYSYLSKLGAGVASGETEND